MKHKWCTVTGEYIQRFIVGKMSLLGGDPKGLAKNTSKQQNNTQMIPKVVFLFFCPPFFALFLLLLVLGTRLLM